MMKISRLLMVASAAFFIAGSAHAQNAGTVTANAFAIGKGPGQSGYTSLLCGATQLAVGQSAADPICRTLTGDVTLSAAGVTAIGSSKVTNAQAATMAANTTKCNATGGTANPTDCNAATMRTNMGVVIGTNVQAWDTDLDCVAALSSTGIMKRTGTGTCAASALALADIATGTQDTLIGYFGSTTASALAINNCSNALTYSTTTHTFGCNATAGTGTLTNVATAGLATGGPITSTGTVTVTGAVKSDQTTASSTAVAVTPGTQQFHPSATKARVKFTGSTGAILGTAYNVSSITRNGTGDYTVNFTTAFANADYQCTAMGSNDGTNDAALVRRPNTAQTTTAMRFLFTNTGGTPTESNPAFIICGGDQ